MTDQPPTVVNPQAVGDPNQTPIVRLWPAPSPTAALLALARDIWGDRRMTLPQICRAAVVVVGDLNRVPRDEDDGAPIDQEAAQRELGNLILSGVRWADDLGLDPDQCVTAAATAQRAYVARLEARRG